MLLKQHIKEHHGIKDENDDLIPQYNNQKYVCGKCGFETHFSLKWLRHMKECKRRSYKTTEKSDWKQHIQRHHVDEKNTKWSK